MFGGERDFSQLPAVRFFRIRRNLFLGRELQGSERFWNMGKEEEKIMTQEILSAISGEVYGVWFLIGAALVFWMQAGFAW